MGVKYSSVGCPRWRGAMHYYIHWAKEHIHAMRTPNYRESILKERFNNINQKQGKV